MITFLGVLGFGFGSFAAGYIWGNVHPLKKPDVEVKWRDRIVAPGRAIPEHPPIP